MTAALNISNTFLKQLLYTFTFAQILVFTTRAKG